MGAEHTKKHETTREPRKPGAGQAQAAPSPQDQDDKAGQNPGNQGVPGLGGQNQVDEGEQRQA